MKKSITTIASALLLIAILASCSGNKPSGDNSKAPDTSKTVSVDDTSKNASKDETKDDSKEELSKPETKEAFTGTVDEILDLIVKKAGELDSANEYNISTIACSHSVVDIDSCDTILGLEDKEFEDYVEAAVESKPDGSWFTHSVVVVKLRDGVDVKTVAEKIVSKTEAVRFGCLRPEAIVGAYTGNYVVFTTSGKGICESVYEAVKELSGTDVTRVDREKNWSDSGLG